MNTIFTGLGGLPRRTRAALLLLLATGGCLASIEVGDLQAPENAGQSVVSLSVGIGYAIVATGGYRFAAPVAAAALLEGLLDGLGLAPSLLLGAGAVVSTAGTVALARAIRPTSDERGPDTIVRFSASAAAVAVGSTVTTTGLAVAGVPGCTGGTGPTASSPSSPA